MGVEIALLDHTLLQTLGKRHKHLTALQIRTVEHSIHRCRETILMRLVLTAVEEVVDSVAVGEHDTIVAPLVAQDINQQSVARTTGFPLETLVGTHHLAHITFLHQRLEGGQIGLPEVTVRGLHIHRVAQRLGTAVHGIVLGTSVGLEVLIVVALHTLYRSHTEHGIHIGILTTGLLTASPTGITEDVHIRAPEGELGIAGIVGHAHGHVEDVVVRAVPVGTGLVRHL